MGLKAQVAANVVAMHTGRAKWSSENNAEAHAPASTRCGGEPCTAAPRATNFMGEAAKHAATRTVCGTTVPVRRGPARKCKHWDPMAPPSHIGAWLGRAAIAGGSRLRTSKIKSSARATPGDARGHGETVGDMLVGLEEVEALPEAEEAQLRRC